ncbi:hypothetical protein ABKN59_011535 [Abortiporus biennis]
MSKPPCRQHSQGKCRYGTRCRFAHDSPAASGSSTRQSTPSRLRTPIPATGSVRSVTGGVCPLFWDTGSCPREFECRYKHEQRTNNATIETAVPNSSDPADFFSSEGFAVHNSFPQEERHSLTPSQAHNHIMSFLRDQYQFEGGSKVQGFVNIFASIHDRNRAWNSDNTQSFVDMLVKGNGLLRIGDVLRFEPVNYRIGSGGVLSFQRGYFPILQFFASDLVLKSTLHKNINHLYTVIEENFEQIAAVLRTCIGGMINEKSWKDPTPSLPSTLQSSLDGAVIFRTVFVVLIQFHNRFKTAIPNHPELAKLIDELADWFDTWTGDVMVVPPRFDDAPVEFNVRRLTIMQLREQIDRLTAIVERETGAIKRQRAPQAAGVSPEQRRQAQISRLAQAYDPPGSLHAGGPRHDNDFESISDIRIAPTHAELLCPTPSYLPPFLSTAPHHLPQDSMERHLDIQFRLLREELIAPIRGSIVTIIDDIATITNSIPTRRREPTKLERLLQSRGGAYRTTGVDSVFFQVYTNLTFTVVKAERREVTVGLEMDAPPSGSARDPDMRKRVDFWEHSKRLQSGSLVALVLVSRGTPKVYLGLISSMGKDISESAKATPDRIQARFTFFDTEVEFMALRGEKITAGHSTFAILIDNGVMYESIRPFLHRIQDIEPTEIPFSQYIARSDLKDVEVSLPRFAMVPRFSFKLQCLAKPGQTLNDLDATLPESIARARQQLLNSSMMDPSQVDAVINTLTREVSLIQGPPGTGKSFTGKEILRVLFTSGIRPIVLIAFTNHALDHMLTSILDDDITKKLVRIGSRSSDERIAEYTLDKLEREVNAQSLDRSSNRQYGVMKRHEESLLEVMHSIQLPAVSWADISSHLEIHYSDQALAIETPPFWIQELYRRSREDAEANGEWEMAQKGKKGKGKDKETSDVDRSLYGFWRRAEDLEFITPKIVNVPMTPQKRVRTKRKKANPGLMPSSDTAIIPEEVSSFFVSLGFPSGVLPPIPSSNRPLQDLFMIENVWSMSSLERTLLASEWEQEVRTTAYNSHLDHYKSLRNDYQEACSGYNDIRDETRRRLLCQTDLIGCTTTGAAKLTSLLSSISPKVLMVEEAGQVLESHILSSLGPDLHQLICIGDPEQLRATLANYTLSMDSDRGKTLYKFDRSLMERLADSGFPMTQINVQRRMRPEISHFIRTILYPRLEDNDVVMNYPRVSGMQHNVFFLNHKNKEGGTEDSVSKFNMYEVEMVRDLVLYLLKQGPYSGPGDIAVLCAYLGQLQKVRAALRDLKIAVSVDERDEAELARQGLEENTAEVEQVIVAKHIRLGTVDIFQGQEAKIVIVSLVRNTGTYETGNASIGFLKSSNRINVALSRAKHGLYILGNASNLRKNSTWSTILDEMEDRGQIGPALPLICPRHPDQKQEISQAGELRRRCPEGGCLLPCATRLPCGHTCPSTCHLDLDNHRSMFCSEPCTRTPCPRNHPCRRRCSDNCGDCEFPLYNVRLPCGHTKEMVPCYKLDKLDSVVCDEQVLKKLPTCEHFATVSCSRNLSSVKCKATCGGILGCCSRACKSPCHKCQTRSNNLIAGDGTIERKLHESHPCERMLYCQHLCGLACAQDHSCNTSCQQQCRQQCIHHHCTNPCSHPCAPCMEPCSWSCEHHSCPVLCGSICTRLPCDEPCRKTLACGHNCPSVCGEPCEDQRCAVCILAENQQSDIVDFVMQRRLEDIDLASTDLSERIITLECGHIFTVETLDGHCGMNDYYEIDPMTGNFLRAKAPPVNFQNPPTCPICKGSITALRYGRVTKRATLDILEQNVASRMSSQLNDLTPEVELLLTELPRLNESAKNIRSITGATSEVSANRSSSGKVDEPLPSRLLNKDSMHNIHGLSSDEAASWHDVVRDIVKLYGKVVKVATTRGAHVKAYEAALSTLYRLEMDSIISDPSRITDTPEPVAIAAVNDKIGQPPHKADTKYQVEAYFLSLEMRLMLAQVGLSRIEGLSASSDEEDINHHRTLWVSFVQFIHDSCVSDAEKSLVVATKSSATRQCARASTYILRAEFESIRFSLRIKRDMLIREKRFLDEKDQLGDTLRIFKADMRRKMDRYEREYVRSRAVNDLLQFQEERKWFSENCRSKVDAWSQECDKLKEFLLNLDGTYQPLSLQEREDIVKAFDFSHRGHFYNCRNGHTFVITECGGAMEASRCPECNEPIGGGNHNLDASNTRATEFEEIAGRHGAQPGHWAWAQGA